MKLTIFTPTYNRSKLLERIFISLKEQKCKEFEWLIIDDGSNDDTEEVVQDFIKDCAINIRYIKKENGGKHTAHNMAVENAIGDFFLCLDSDDILAQSAVNRILESVSKLQANDCGFIAYKKDHYGKLLGAPIPEHPERHYGLYGYQKNYGINGEYAMILRTDILRKYLFPIIVGEKFMGECVLYDRLELDGFTFCPLQEIVEICEYQQEGLSQNYYKLLCENPAGYALYYLQRLKLSRDIKEAVMYGIRYNAFQILSRMQKHKKCSYCNWIVIFTWLPGLLAANYYLLVNIIKRERENK